MLHEPAVQCGPDASAQYKKQLGVIMFLLYGFFYAVFVGINMIQPIMMEKIVLMGMNLAVVYGFGLIVMALFLALIYNHMCTKHEMSCKEGEK